MSFAHRLARRAYGSSLLPNVIRAMLQHRRLLFEMTRRELTDSHAGTGFGAVWTVAHPLLYIIVYLFLFAGVLKTRIGAKGAPDYAAYLLSGLVPWLICQDAMTRSVRSVLGSASLVKKVVFPVEILPAKSVFAAFFAGGITLAAYLVYLLSSANGIPVTAALVPVLLVLLAVGLLGIGCFLGAVAPYFRDLPELVRVFAMLNAYAIPVVYLPGWVPGPLRGLLWVNPFSHVVWCFQDALYFGRFEHPYAWPIFAALSLISLAGGIAAFSRLRPHFGSVL
jgi:lipopolysaccharide transport system permease protein